jgi:hypothetical protein
MDHRVEQPARPDLLPAWSRPERRWWPLAAVLGVIAFVVFGGYLIAAALSEPAGPPLGPGGVVQVRPLSGWELSLSGPVQLTFEVAGETQEARGLLDQLTRGNGNLAIVALRVGSLPPQDLAQSYILGELSSQLDQLTVSHNIHDVTLGSGERAVRITYVGVLAPSGISVEGELTVVVTPQGVGVIFNAFAPEGILQFILGDVHAMEDDAGFVV